MSLPNPGMTFTPFDPLAASELNDLVENIESLEDGSGFALGNNVIPANALATDAISLGYAQITTSFNTSSSSEVQVTGLSSTVTIPAGGRKVRITAWASSIQNNTLNSYAKMGIWDGTVNSGTELAYIEYRAAVASQVLPVVVTAIVTPSAGSKTYNVGLSNDASSGTAQINAFAAAPAFILVETI